MIESMHSKIEQGNTTGFNGESLYTSWLWLPYN